MSEEGNEQEQRRQQEEVNPSEIVQHLVNGEDQWSSEDEIASNPDNTEEGGYTLLSQNLSDEEDNDNQLTVVPNRHLIDSYPQPTDSNSIPDLPENESSSVEYTQQILMEEGTYSLVQLSKSTQYPFMIFS